MVELEWKWKVNHRNRPDRRSKKALNTGCMSLPKHWVRRIVFKDRRTRDLSNKKIFAMSNQKKKNLNSSSSSNSIPRMTQKTCNRIKTAKAPQAASSISLKTIDFCPPRIPPHATRWTRSRSILKEKESWNKRKRKRKKGPGCSATSPPCKMRAQRPGSLIIQIKDSSNMTKELLLSMILGSKHQKP